MNILLSQSRGAKYPHRELRGRTCGRERGWGWRTQLLLLQGLYWLAKCPYNEEITANTGNGQPRWWQCVSPHQLIVSIDY